MRRAAAVALCLLPLAIGGATPRPATAPACRVAVPADVSRRPAAWLGACSGGAADGLGVLRGGTREPYDLFAGRMAAGRPVDGLLILGNGDWLVAERFDAHGNTVALKDGSGGRFQALFDRAAASAELVARRMAAAGNAGSAAYYRRLAVRIRHAPPE